MSLSPWRKPLLAAALLGCLAAPVLADSTKAARYYEDALKRFERHDVDGAIIQLKNALQQDASLLTVHVLLGRALLQRGEAAAAEIEFTEALQQGINRAEVAVPLARALVAQGKQAEVFKRPVLNPAGLPPATQQALLLVRAGASSDLGDPRAAQQQIEEARAINPESPDPWLAEVPILLRTRQFDRAQAAAEQGLKRAPDNAEAWYQKGSIAHVQARTDQALKDYDRAIALDAQHAEAQLARAGILMDQGRLDEARTEVQRLLKIAPNEPRVLYLSAVQAEQRGEAAAAKDALKAITAQLDPVPIDYIRYRPQALMLNGLAHFGLGEMDKAKPYLEYAQRLQPASPLAKVLAQVYAAEPNLDRASAVLDTYLRAFPGDSSALVMMASVQMAQGRHARATALMQEALRSKDSPEFRTALGISLLRSGQFEDATEELEKAFQRNPRQGYAGMALATLYLRKGQAAKAVAVANKLTQAQPANPSAWVLQASTKFRAGDLPGSRAAYQQAAKLDASLMEAQLGLARVDTASRQFDAAQARLDGLLRANERNVDALYEMALLTEARGQTREVQRWLAKAADFSTGRQIRADLALVGWLLRQDQAPAALEAAKKLLAKAPEDVSAMTLYARAQLANRDPVGARSTLTSAARRAGFEPRALVEIAGLQATAKDLPGAAYTLDKALSASPKDLGALALFSSVALQQGDAALAERHARQIIQLQPNQALGHTLLADVAQSRGQQPQALESLRRAHELQPTSGSLLALIRAQQQQGNLKAGQELAERWLKARPNDAAVHKGLADLLAQSGQFLPARRSYEAALKLRPNDPEALNNLANVLIRLGDSGAAAVAEKALALDPRNPNVIDTAGWAQHLAGNGDRGLQLLRDARLRDPDNPDIRYHLAAALAQAGRKAEARQELDAALRSKSFESHKEALALSQTLK